MDKILAMGFKAEDIYALISPAGSFEYDLPFVCPEPLDLFWEWLEHVYGGQPDWKGLVPKVVSRQPLIENVTILTRNESIPPEDLWVWLRRFGERCVP